MVRHMFPAIAIAALLCSGCEQAANGSGASTLPTSPSSVATTSVERPFKAHFDWWSTGIQWAGVPGQAKSVFDGRCSVPSDYIISSALKGEATELGRITAEGSHCSQITWSPQGQPLGVTYSDGRGTLVSANGSRFALAWDNGVTGFDATTGETWFRDTLTFSGLSGLFKGATGTAQEGGRFRDLGAVLSGQRVPMWAEGTMTWAAGHGTR